MSTSFDYRAKGVVAKRPVFAASIAVFRGHEVLLVKRAQKLGQGLWSLPGGKVEFGEEAASAALRELMEETSVSARIIGFVGNYEIILPDAHYVIAAHVGLYVEGEIKVASDAAEARFVVVDHIETYDLAPHTFAAVRAARAICQI